MPIVTLAREPVRAGFAQPETWQQALKAAIRDPVELCRRLELPDEFIPAAVRAAELFPVFVPPAFLAKIRRGDPHDPLLRQVLPLADELHSPPHFTRDPVGDGPATRSPGLLQKYAGRSLIVTTGACAVHCRYCFRRHFPYSESPRSPDEWQPAIDQLAADDSIDEVLLSGGDPLMIVDAQLEVLAERLAEVPHLRRLRVHSRLPVMIPQRVTDRLLGWLRGTRLTPLVVIHANHPAELGDDVAEAIGRLVDAGIPVLNQAVLLRGVNDDVETLAELCRRLVDQRVMPYYLHQLDRVVGAAHFEVPIETGLRLVEELRSRLPGYAVPRYVQEVPGAESKVVLA